MHKLMRSVVIAVATLALVGGCDKKDGKGGASAKGGESPGLGAAKGGTPTSREGQAFLLGVKVSQAAMANGRAEADVVNRTFATANTVSEIILETKLPPLPAPTGDRAEDGAAGLHYLLDTIGKSLGGKIEAELGPEAAATFELAVKMNMLPVLYVGGPDDDMAKTLMEVLEKRAASAKLPPAALAPLLTKMKAGAPHGEIVDLVFDLNDSLAVEIGKIYEKPDPAPAAK
jgi:hypothetical protein